MKKLFIKKDEAIVREVEVTNCNLLYFEFQAEVDSDVMATIFFADIFGNNTPTMEEIGYNWENTGYAVHYDENGNIDGIELNYEFIIQAAVSPVELDKESLLCQYTEEENNMKKNGTLIEEMMGSRRVYNKKGEVNMIRTMNEFCRKILEGKTSLDILEDMDKLVQDMKTRFTSVKLMETEKDELTFDSFRILTSLFRIMYNAGITESRMNKCFEQITKDLDKAMELNSKYHWHHTIVQDRNARVITDTVIPWLNDEPFEVNLKLMEITKGISDELPNGANMVSRVDVNGNLVDIYTNVRSKEIVGDNFNLLKMSNLAKEFLKSVYNKDEDKGLEYIMNTLKSIFDGKVAHIDIESNGETIKNSDSSLEGYRRISKVAGISKFSEEDTKISELKGNQPRLEEEPNQTTEKIEPKTSIDCNQEEDDEVRDVKICSLLIGNGEKSFDILDSSREIISRAIERYDSKKYILPKYDPSKELSENIFRSAYNNFITNEKDHALDYDKKEKIFGLTLFVDLNKIPDEDNSMTEEFRSIMESINVNNFNYDAFFKDLLNVIEFRRKKNENLEKSNECVLDMIKNTSNSITNSRTPLTIMMQLTSEVGELAEELRVKYDDSFYKGEGKDGVLGEGCDCLIALLDLLYKSGYTQEDIARVTKTKLEKWHDKASSK